MCPSIPHLGELGSQESRTHRRIGRRTRRHMQSFPQPEHPALFVSCKGGRQAGPGPTTRRLTSITGAEPRMGAVERSFISFLHFAKG